MKCTLNPKKIMYLVLGVTVFLCFFGLETIQRWWKQALQRYGLKSRAQYTIDLGESSLLRQFGYKCVRKLKKKRVAKKVCNVNYDDNRGHVSSGCDLKMIYFVTPTYPRPEQVPELTRLAHTLMHVPRIHWIVADEQPVCSDQVLNILRYPPKGVANRLAAIEWLLHTKKEGIVYFFDDDNVVDLRLFEEIRITKGVSMFPVGLIGRYGVSSPVVKNGKVSAFFDSWPGHRKFPVDMAGFAVNIKLLNWSTTMPYVAGDEENKFLISLGVNVEDIQPLAENCSKVMVWHTRTRSNHKPRLRIDVDKLDNVFIQNYQNVVPLLKEIYKLGMAVPNPINTSAITIRNSQIYGKLVRLSTDDG